MALLEEFEKQGIWLFKYRGTLPLLILLIGTTLYIRTKLWPETFFMEETPYEGYYETLCFLISFFGLGIRIYTVGLTPKNTSGRNVNEQVADVLNTTGIYSVVRHPLYVGNFFMWLGPALLTGNFWFILSFCLIYWIYYERIMFAEEQFLRRKFGDFYLNWATKVPAFIPDFTHFVKPALVFSWKKVLKKEKNGLAAVCIIFFLFDISGELIQDKKNYNQLIMCSFLLSVPAYIILKFLKKYTVYLNEADR